MPVSSVNTADHEVTGAALKGSVGDTVTAAAVVAGAGMLLIVRRRRVRNLG